MTPFFRGMMVAMFLVLACAWSASAWQEKYGKDPTTPSPKLKEVMNAGKILGPAGPVYVAGEVTLRGRILVKGQPPAAVVDVGGKIYNVAKDSTVPGGVYRILEITSEEVRIENLLTKQVTGLR